MEGAQSTVDAKAPAKLTPDEQKKVGPLFSFLQCCMSGIKCGTLATPTFSAVIMGYIKGGWSSSLHLQEISKAVEPKDGQQGTVPPTEEREGYVADLDE